MSVESTAYCLQGRTASGLGVRDGIVAMNGFDFGTKWRILSGPLRGKIVEVQDRIFEGSEFDIWMAFCSDAIAYGRQTITIEEVRNEPDNKMPR